MNEHEKALPAGGPAKPTQNAVKIYVISSRFSAMHVSSWGKSSAHWFCSPDEVFTPHPALNTNRYYKLPTQGAFLCL